ncbi:hypothetical protein [Microbacterium allomyrinae]|nr:hypothetical protein [Microbacterium allomyrinae]
MVDQTTPAEIDPADSAWELEGDDSLGDAEEPTRNDDPEVTA